MCKFLHLKLLAVIIIISYDKSANYINKTILLPRFAKKMKISAYLILVSIKMICSKNLSVPLIYKHTIAVAIKSVFFLYSFCVSFEYKIFGRQGTYKH